MHEFPLLDKISFILNHKLSGFHTPGHQEGHGITRELTRIFQEGGLKLDLTELPGLDNLKKPEGCLKESQGLAARLFGACKTFFLVNGSTIGLQAALLASGKPDNKVILSRQAHVSILNGMVLSGTIPVPLAVNIDEKWGIPLGLRPDDLRQFLKHGSTCKTMVLTQPNYQGVAADAFEIKKICNEQGILLITDEAHGAHLFFQNELPVSSQKAGADIVVQSTHKTLSAFTQASMLHVNNKAFKKPVEDALDLLQTSSPSYLLLASLDAVQGQMRAMGRDIVSNTIELARQLRRKIQKIKGYQIFDAGLKNEIFQDPVKIVLSAAELGLTGWELADILCRKYGVFVEFSDYYYVLFLITPGHRSEDMALLLKALKDIALFESKSKQINCDKYVSLYKEDEPVVLSPRQVYYQTKEEVQTGQAIGRIAGKPLTVYPPGIPLVWPGQVLKEEHLECITWSKRQGLPVQGLTEKDMITVVKEDYKGG